VDWKLSSCPAFEKPRVELDKKPAMKKSTLFSPLANPFGNKELARLWKEKDDEAAFSSR
jgi:hypothetical protein